MMPVDATPTREASRPRSSPASACEARAVPSPRSPLATFELPELASTARSPSSRASEDTATGAPTRALDVNRAAEVVSGSSDTSRPTSSPSGLIPAATPAARNLAGRDVGSSSRT
jgi:hypothetical protein